jgi:hypothetical protein
MKGKRRWRQLPPLCLFHRHRTTNVRSLHDKHFLEKEKEKDREKEKMIGLGEFHEEEPRPLFVFLL